MNPVPESGRWERGLAALFVILALLVGGVWLWGTWRMKPAGKTAETPVFSPATVPDLASARKTVAEYFQAPDDKRRLVFLHDASRVRPLWMDYYHRRRKPFAVLARLDEGRLALSGGRILAFFQAELQPGGVKPIALVWEDGKFRIDWESSFAYGTMDWIEWVETRPAASQLLRIYMSQASLDSLPRGEKDRGWWQVIVEHPDGLEPLAAWISPEVPLPVDFRGRQKIPVTAEFKFSSGRIELVRFGYEGWSR